MYALSRSLRSFAGFSNIYRRSLVAFSISNSQIPALFVSSKSIHSRVPMASISTTYSPQSNAPSSAGTDEYDAEIKDIASYVHNFNISSKLAVNLVLFMRADRKH